MAVTAAAPSRSVSGGGRRSRAARAFFRDRVAVVGMLMLAVIIAGALWPVAWLPHAPAWSDLDKRLVPPSFLAGGCPVHVLGTDNLGRDLLSRMMYGGRFSLFVALVAVALAAVIGISSGVAA